MFRHPTYLAVFLIIGFALPRAAAQDDCIDPQQIDDTAICPSVYDPVCGCDGQDYYNACVAELQHGVTAWTAGQCAEACQAQFLFSPVMDGPAFYLFNTSTNYDSSSWTVNGQPLPDLPQQPVVIAPLPEGGGTVCLTVWNDSGCTDTFCQAVFVGSPDELCQQTDCVWPGDANGNGIANNYDLSNIGLGFGAAGPERVHFPNPSNPIFWAPNLAENWGQHAGTVDYKHLDCDGDGFIDEMDVMAIDLNYSPELEVQSEPSLDGVPVYLAFDTSSFSINGATPEYFGLSAGLYVGSESLPAYDLHSVSLYLKYPGDLVVSHTVTVNYEADAFLGDEEETMSVQRDLTSYGLPRYDLAWSRKNNGGADGYGRLATVNFIISSDIIMGLAAPETPFSTEVEGVFLINVEGDTLNYSLPGADTVIILDETVAGSADRAAKDLLRVFPNPAVDLLEVYLPMDVRSGRLMLVDAQGRQLWQGTAQPGAQQISLNGLPSGIYLLRALLDDGRQLSRRVVVK